jgi:hypothetical protein
MRQYIRITTSSILWWPIVDRPALANLLVELRCVDGVAA